jgi:lysyl-tRNA synthetase class 1
MEDTLFWADQKAKEILERRRFRYVEREIEPFDEYVVKTSASISGVLHIGRLSDSIRGEAVCRALLDRGVEAKLIWVAEDMDPLRKVPRGVPGELEEHIGAPVTSVPDPWGCHSSFAEHHVSEYFEVLEDFLSLDFERYSMREEYRRGSFRPFISRMFERIDEVRRIQGKYRELPDNWSPWVPICRECGKIITPRVVGFEGRRLVYRCEDYTFEGSLARGCGYEGEADPLRDEGKLLWKGEWAAQWARWRGASEGAGKEYVVPTSAWWVNAELSERVLEFPMPVPIFYEHLMIDGRKMSASLGNVVYPREWLEVAPPQLLRFFYNKKLMKTRSFSWSYLPNLYDDYDRHAREYFSPKEEGRRGRHMRRLYEISQLGSPEPPVGVSFSHLAALARVFSRVEDILESLKRSGHEVEPRELLERRARHAMAWVAKHASEEALELEEVRRRLGEGEKRLLLELSRLVEEGAEPERGDGLEIGGDFEVVRFFLFGGLQV